MRRYYDREFFDFYCIVIRKEQSSFGRCYYFGIIMLFKDYIELCVILQKEGDYRLESKFYIIIIVIKMFYVVIWNLGSLD